MAAFLLLLLFLSACAPKAPELPKGFVCWPEKEQGILVCQFIPAEQGK